MTRSRLEQPIRAIAVRSIDLYRQHLSPRKGFACPHRLVYGGASCSDYVRTALLEQDLTTAVQQSWHRFQTCGQTARQWTPQASGGCIVIPCCIPL